MKRNIILMIVIGIMFLVNLFAEVNRNKEDHIYTTECRHEEPIEEYICTAECDHKELKKEHICKEKCELAKDHECKLEEKKCELAELKKDCSAVSLEKDKKDQIKGAKKAPCKLDK